MASTGFLGGIRHALAVTIRIGWLIFNHLVQHPGHVVWLVVLYPFRWILPRFYRFAESSLYGMVLSGIAGWGWGVGHRVVEYGQDIGACCESRCIVMCNHQSTADVPLMFVVLQNKANVLSRVMWIMDRILQYTHFGAVAKIHGDYFIQQFSKCRDNELEMLRRHVREVYYPLERKWVILFPEGGFLYKRREKSQRYAKKNDLPFLEHVALPRVGALQALLQSMTGSQCLAVNGATKLKGDCFEEDQSVKYIIDITLGYPDQEPLDFLSFAAGTKGAKKIHVYYRYYSVDAIPIDTDGLTKWLYDRYVEKEYLLAELYRTGAYPVLESEHNRNKFKIQPREIIDSKRWFVVMHAFFLASAYFFVVVFYRIYSSLQQWFF